MKAASRPDHRQILQQSPIFTALNDDELTDLAALSHERRCAAGEMVFWEDDPSDWFYLIAEGSIKVTKSASGGKEVILAFFGPGEMFGEAAVFENQPYPASTQAISATRLIGVRKSDFLAFLLRHPEVALKIIGILSSRLRESQSRLRDLAVERVEQRLARLLLRLSARLGATLPFTRQELSDMAGTTTETTIRVLGAWKNRGVIRSGRGAITISDEARLKELAAGPL